MRKSVERPSVTAKPEITTVRPAVRIVFTTESPGVLEGFANSSL